jgi:hypothetical protein
LLFISILDTSSLYDVLGAFDNALVCFIALLNLVGTDLSRPCGQSILEQGRDKLVPTKCCYI